MKRNEFYTESQLMSMPLKVVRSLDIQDKIQESLVQRVVDRRLAVLPPSQNINRRDVPDIKTPDEEAHWQEIMDERTAKLRPQLMSIDNANVDKIKEYKQVDMLDPESASFNPDKVEMADKASDQTPDISATGRAQTVAERIKELEKPVEGRPLTLSGGVSSKLVGKIKKK